MDQIQMKHGGSRIKMTLNHRPGMEVGRTGRMMLIPTYLEFLPPHELVDLSSIFLKDLCTSFQFLCFGMVEDR